MNLEMSAAYSSFLLNRSAVRGKYFYTLNEPIGRITPLTVVMRGLVPRIHVFLCAARRGWQTQKSKAQEVPQDPGFGAVMKSCGS